jgi:co-chaperonin GroES (HSP10)
MSISNVLDSFQSNILISLRSFLVSLIYSMKQVVAVGPGPLNEDGSRKALSITPGNDVMYSKYAGSEFKGEDGEYIVLKASDVLAVLPQS